MNASPDSTLAAQPTAWPSVVVISPFYNGADFIERSVKSVFEQTVPHAGVLLGVGGIAGHAHKHLEDWQPGHGGRARLIQSFSAVTAACLVVRKSQIGRAHV